MLDETLQHGGTMSLTPDWLPNIHPIVVHFPIALLSTAFIVDSIGLFMRRRIAVQHTVTWLYCAGAALAILAYLTGRSGADELLLPAQVSPLVDEHADWAFRMTWFFALFASVRVAISYIFPPKTIVLGTAFVLAIAGIVMLFETAEHGAELVFKHGLGVQQITIDEPIDNTVFSASNLSSVDPGIIELDNNSWVWRPIEGANLILSEQFTWLESNEASVISEIVKDPDHGTVLGLYLHEIPILFVAGEAIDTTQADVNVNLDGFNGTFRMVFHVQDESTYDFLAFDDTSVTLGRTDNGVETIFEEKLLDYSGWLDLRVFGGNGHFRGYLNGELLTHGHATDLPAGPFGFKIDGVGTVLIESIRVQSVT